MPHTIIHQASTEHELACGFPLSADNYPEVNRLFHMADRRATGWVTIADLQVGSRQLSRIYITPSCHRSGAHGSLSV